MLGIVFALVLLLILSFGPIDFAQVAWRVNAVYHKNGKIKKRKLKGKDLIMSYCPVFNVCVVRKAFYRKYGFTLPMAIAGSVFVALRFIMTGIPPLAIAAVDNTIIGNIQIASLPLMYVGLIIIHLLHLIVYVDISRMFRFGIIYYILLVLIPEGAVMFLATQVPMQMNANKEALNNRFNENYKTAARHKRRQA